MRNIMLAIAAMAFATLAPFAVAAEGQGDNAEKEPTMAELGNKINGLSSQITRLEATVGTLATTVTANHTTIVGKFAPQMAVVMSVPQWHSSGNGGASETFGSRARLNLVGESTIPGFPTGTVAADGRFTDATLPAGTYLFELQQPYGGNAICQSELSRGFLPRSNNGKRRNDVCPRVRLHPFSSTTRLEDGFGIYTYAAPASFRLDHKWPPGLKFSDDTTLSATERASASSFANYTGAVRITKLK